MTAVEPAKERIVRQLMEAVERLHGDIERVELWASALGGFTRPVPDYDPAKSKLNRFVLPRSSDRAAEGNDFSLRNEAQDQAQDEAQDKAQHEATAGPNPAPKARSERSMRGP